MRILMILAILCLNQVTLANVDLVSDGRDINQLVITGEDATSLTQLIEAHPEATFSEQLNCEASSCTAQLTGQIYRQQLAKDQVLLASEDWKIQAQRELDAYVPHSRMVELDTYTSVEGVNKRSPRTIGLGEKSDTYVQILKLRSKNRSLRVICSTKVISAHTKPDVLDNCSLAGIVKFK